jgi:hypothetical protein
MVGICKLLNDSSLLDVFQAGFREVEFVENQIISNPPYEVAELTMFLEWILSVQDSGGISILLIPKGFIQKERPKALVNILQQFSVIEKEDMRESFERTAIKAEIVVLRKI